MAGIELDDAILHGPAGLPCGKIVQKVADEGLILIVATSGGVGGNETVRRGPERMVGRERFGLHHIEISGSKGSGVQGSH